MNVITGTTPKLTSEQSDALRDQLAHLRARYDSGAISPATYSVIRAIEKDIAWTEHQRARS